MQVLELNEQIEILQQQRRQLEIEMFHLRKTLIHNEIYRPQTLYFSERGISNTAEQIIENLAKMNCFQEPQNFSPSFFENVIVSLQQESKVGANFPSFSFSCVISKQNEVEIPKILYYLSTSLGLLHLLSIINLTLRTEKI